MIVLVLMDTKAAKVVAKKSTTVPQFLVLVTYMRFVRRLVLDNTLVIVRLGMLGMVSLV
jgi:hypothetical protein